MKTLINQTRTPSKHRIQYLLIENKEIDLISFFFFIKTYGFMGSKLKRKLWFLEYMSYKHANGNCLFEWKLKSIL